MLILNALNPHPSIFAEAPYNRSQLMLGESLRLAKQVQKPANSDAENPTLDQDRRAVIREGGSLLIY